MSDASAEVAHAKINLALHVRARNPDGYHAIETLFAFAADGDLLRAEIGEEITLSVTGPFAPALAGEGDNLVLRAARALRAAFGIGQGAAIHLDKHLPVASGIGGGSADAAATLRLLTRLWGLPGDDPRLGAIARELGADVPACLLSKSCRGDGRGDQLRLVNDAQFRGMPLLLVNPGVAVATGPVFAGWDRVDRGALGEGFDAALAGRNDLEAPARAIAPAIGAVLGILRDQTGVRLARMSGSGATCFALFADIAARDAAEATLDASWWRLKTVLI